MESWASVASDSTASFIHVILSHLESDLDLI